MGDDRQRLLTLTATLTLSTLAASAGDATNTLVLNTDSFWRFRTVWETPELLLPSGRVEHTHVTWARDAGNWLSQNPTQGVLPEDKWTATQRVETIRLPADTAADWMKPEFDDSTWARLRGPMLPNTISESWKLILMRGRFLVPDPAKAGDLTLSLAFKGGAVVYLNGQELTRTFLPKGPLDLYTPAESYPEDVYFTSEGFLMFRKDRSADAMPRMERRVRRLDNFRIPAARLRKGVNVLAVANHRAPTLAKDYAARTKGYNYRHEDCNWAKIGLLEARLSASPGGVTPNTVALPGRGFKIWNQSVIQTVFLPDYPDPFSPLSPIRLTGVKNGIFAGQIVVGDEKPIRGLTVRIGDFKGPGVIPAAAARIRYGVADGPPERGTGRFFDSLEDVPPAEVPVYPEHGGSVQPVWITVKVPADAKPGDYAGAVTLGAEGVPPTSVPILVRVMDWTLPAVDHYVARMDLVQSPESVALAYDVPFWSEAHLQLLDKTFALLAELSCKTLFVTCVRRTHLGNEHALVRWIRGDDGELRPDFAIVEKYLDVAVKHLGKIPGVILYAWEPPESQGHAGGAGGAARTYDKPILYTLLNPQTGKLSPRQGPAWGTPEAKEFWKKLTDGIRPVLAKRGLENSMLFGLLGDTRATKQAMDDICAGIGPTAKWAVHSHYYCDKWQGYDMGMAIALWGIGVQPADPSAGYSFGWSNPFWLSYYPREMKIQSTLVEHRVKLENWMAGRASYTPFICTGRGPRGLGRIGVDFWPVLKDERGRIRGSLAGRFPEAAWGQLNLNFCIPYILGKGKNGPLATVRSEAFRESLQEVEARIYLEKAWLDDEAKPLLGDELRGRIRKALDERIRMCLHSSGEGEPWYIGSDWCRRNELLFGLAAEVAAKYGDKAPTPNLNREEKKKK